MHVSFMKGVLISHAKASKTFFSFAKKKSKTGRLHFFCGILKTNTTLHIHFEVIFLEVLNIYVMQHMPFDESFYLKCPMSPKSTHIFFAWVVTVGRKLLNLAASVSPLESPNHTFLIIYILLIFLCSKQISLKQLGRQGFNLLLKCLRGQKCSKQPQEPSLSSKL